MESGETIGDYEIRRRIAKHGGGGAVYEAVHVTERRGVALKVLPPAGGSAEAARFARELRFSQELSHKHIVPVYDVEQVNGQVLIAMQLVDGHDLTAYQGRPLAPENAVAIGTQLASALGYAHEIDIVHRDVKPANAMIDSHGHVFLMDFGLAKAREDETLTRTGLAVGTPGFMSPEQCLGHRVDHRTDIYALGCVLYFLLTGKHVFRGPGYEQLEAHIREPPPLLAATEPRLARFDPVIQSALAKDPAERVQSAQEFVAGLRSAVEPEHGGSIDTTRLVQSSVELCGRALLKVSEYGYASVVELAPDGTLVESWADGFGATADTGDWPGTWEVLGSGQLRIDVGPYSLVVEEAGGARVRQGVEVGPYGSAAFVVGLLDFRDRADDSDVLLLLARDADRIVVALVELEEHDRRRITPLLGSSVPPEWELGSWYRDGGEIVIGLGPEVPIILRDRNRDDLEVESLGSPAIRHGYCASSLRLVACLEA